ncbi:MAG: homoserine O-acetyltransferase [Planctomycetes bacterium]|nr:homoserine O-acetyltransferase [Planctomycetota bacterium]
MAKIDENSVGIVETKTICIVQADSPLSLESGKTLGPIDVAYETYGLINEKKDNVILICHALSGNAHVAGHNSPDDKKPGWWDMMVGPGKGIDTNKYFVICSNFLGGCSGTTGPSSINPKTKKPYGLDFPMITIADMVKVQKMLLEKLGINKILAVIGGSMGGMQVLQWAIEYPDFMRAIIPIATTTRLNAQSIAFDAVGRNAIIGDPYFNDGQYQDKQGPDKGLSIARMIGHITYLSEKGMHEKFGRELKTAEDYKYEFNSEFAVETYLDHQGQAFVERFDANSYLYITKAMDYFDIERSYGSLKKAFAKVKSRVFVISFISDWLFTPAQSRAIVDALFANDKDISFCDIDSPYGHDAFLLEPETIGAFISGFLHAVHEPQAKQPQKTDSTRKKRRLRRLDDAIRTRVDYELIESLIEPDSKILDLGCGDGQLLTSLIEDKNIKGHGLELEQDLVLECINQGLPIIQYDLYQALKNCEDKSFDYVILSQTVQTIKETEKVFTEMLRVGKKVIVSFPNFAHWRCRAQLLFTGKAPKTKQLHFDWYNSPNVHCLSLKDFDQFCDKLNAKIEKKIPITKKRLAPVKLAPNFFAEQVIYVASKD